MEARSSILRERFFCETDIKLEPTPDDWRHYALWLEKDVVTRLNAETMAENILLRDAFFHVTDLLDTALERPVNVGKTALDG